MTTVTDEVDKFIAASAVDWSHIPVGVFLLTGEAPDNDRIMDCHTVKNSGIFRYRSRNLSGVAQAHWGRPRSTRSYSTPIAGTPAEKTPRIYGRVPIGIKVPKYSMMRKLRQTYFSGIPIGSMVLDSKGSMWRLIGHDAIGSFIMHKQGDATAHDRVHPGFGITEYFNHRRFNASPFRIKQFSSPEYDDGMSVMLPSQGDVADAKQLFELHKRRANMSAWVPAGYVPELVIPEKKYESEWAMLDDMCA